MLGYEENRALSAWKSLPKTDQDTLKARPAFKITRHTPGGKFVFERDGDLLMVWDARTNQFIGSLAISDH